MGRGRGVGHWFSWWQLQRLWRVGAKARGLPARRAVCGTARSGLPEPQRPPVPPPSLLPPASPTRPSGSGAYGGRMRILADSRRLAQPTAPRVHARVR
jgi:hypothetical protein